jgi:serine protease
LLTGCAAITAISASAFITPAVATAATAKPAAPTSAAAKPTIHPLPTAQVPGLAVRAVNLHSQFEHAMTSGAVRIGTTKYYSATGGLGSAGAPAASAAPAAAAACKEPTCKMSRHGGPVQHSPKVYVVFWGPGWNTTNSDESTVENYLLGMYHGLGQTKFDSWSTITSQYADSTGHPAFPGTTVLAGTIIDVSTPPSNVSPSDIGAEAAAGAGAFNIVPGNASDNAQIIVASDTGTCFTDGFGGNCGTPRSSGYCAWHTNLVATSGNAFLPFTNLPWQLDAGSGCGAGFVNGSRGALDGWSMAGGHEYAETVTDPVPNTGWVDTADRVSGGEIADKCAFGGRPFGLHDPIGNITLPIGTSNGKTVTAPFAMQSLWSNAANRCIMTASPQLTVTKPATQRSTIGSSVSLQIIAPTNTHSPSTFKASGLPPGLSINSSGKITGKASVTAGTFTPKVTVSDYAKTASVTFTWQVASTAGRVTGPAAKCLDVASGATTSGTKIDLWPCLSQSRQKVIFNFGGELAVVGKCVTLANTTGTALTLQTCMSTSNQVWRRTSSGEYVLKTDAKCLTAPKTTNGTQLTIATCQNTSSQHWSLP